MPFSPDRRASLSYSRGGYRDRIRDEKERRRSRSKERELARGREQSYRDSKGTPDSIKSPPPSRTAPLPPTLPAALQFLESPNSELLSRSSSCATVEQSLRGLSLSTSLVGDHRDPLPKRDSLSITTVPGTKERNVRTSDPRPRLNDTTRIVTKEESVRAGSASNTAIPVTHTENPGSTSEAIRISQQKLSFASTKGISDTITNTPQGSFNDKPEIAPHVSATLPPRNPPPPQAVDSNKLEPEPAQVAQAQLPDFGHPTSVLLAEPTTPFAASPIFKTSAPPQVLATDNSRSDAIEPEEINMETERDNGNAWETLLQWVYLYYFAMMEMLTRIDRL